jgi:hypothetical protein
MQYVPGTTLERIIDALAQRPCHQPTGQAILEIVDEQVSDPAALDLAALRDRELLASLDAIEASCWMGARLAEALAHAHRLGVLHRDVKPANILVNRYGRPLLVDFNVAVQAAGDPHQPLGGTLAYMPPEHLSAYQSRDYSISVDARADLYALGVVLYELFAGRRPYDVPTGKSTLSEVIAALIEQRRSGSPALPPEVAASPALHRVIARCLAPKPEDRFQNGAELADALESCRELRRVQRDLPPGRLLTRLTLRQPFLIAAVLMSLPHVLGSIVNITYNTLLIVLTEAQQEIFPTIVLVYNVILYPLCLCLLFRQVVPVFRTWRDLRCPASIDPEQVVHARRKALQLPNWGIGLSCLGWLPGGLIFPLALHILAGPVSGEVFWRFLFSFTISGLIALTYSVIAVEFVVVRVLYPGLWLDARSLTSTARSDLAREEGRLAVLQFLAVLIPLMGASLILGVGPEEFTPSSYRTFRLLVTTLLAAGMIGLGLALLAGHELRHTVAALISPANRRRQ